MGICNGGIKIIKNQGTTNKGDFTIRKCPDKLKV